MPIQYSLVENRLTPDPDDYFAQVTPMDSLDLDGLVQRIMAAGSTVTEPDTRAVLAAVKQEVRLALAEGYRINLDDLVQLSVSITGVFHGITDTYDPSRHTLQLATQSDPGLLTYLRQNGAPVKQAAADNRAVLLTYHDLASTEVNTTITPATIGTLDGARLAYVTTRVDEGLYLVPVGGGPEVKVPVANFQMNKPARLVFLVPALTAGQWRLEMRNRPGLTERSPLRIGTLNAILTRP